MIGVESRGIRFGLVGRRPSFDEEDSAIVDDKVVNQDKALIIPVFDDSA